MFPERVADMTPEQRQQWDELQRQAEIRRQYRAAGKLKEWEKGREKSKPLGPLSTDPAPEPEPAIA